MPVTSTTFARATIALLLVGLLTLLGIVAASLWLADRTETYADSILDLQQIRRSIFRVVDLVQDAETGQRGFLLTMEEPYLEPFTVPAAGMEKELGTLREFVRGRPALETEARQLDELVRAKIAELRETVDLAQAGRRDAALAIVRTGAGERTMDEIRRVSNNLITAIETRLRQSAGAMRSSSRTLNWVLELGGGLILLVVGGSTWVAWRYTRDLEHARREVVGLNAGLEERVRERTAALARANQEIQRFAYIVSHDLRSPLVNIMGFTSELEAGLAAVRAELDRTPPHDDIVGREARLALQTELPEALGFIRSSTTKMDNLINAILKLSREGARVLTPTRIDMRELLSGTADSVRHRLEEAGGELLIETPIPDLVSDRLALEQVFGNLVDNAVKYLDPKRPGRVMLRGREAGPNLIYEIEDNGRGIAPADHARIFELFRRAGVQDQPGEGIGLSHVRALVRRLGGDIELESELGRGTTFRVRLPKIMPSNEAHT